VVVSGGTSPAAGAVIADGELTQEVRGETVRVDVRWRFADGRQVDEYDEFRAAIDLAQRRFSWVESRAGGELRRFP
jgi:hypothetical protein